MFGVERVIALLDQFPQGQQFRVSARNSKFHSVTGAFGAIALLIITVIYTSSKVHILFNYLDTKITTTVTDDVFNGQNFLNLTVGENISDYGFPFGFAFTVFDKDFSWPKDLDRIGTPRVSNIGHFFDPIAYIDLDPVNVLKQHNCTKQELAQIGGFDSDIPEFQISQYRCLDFGQQISVTADKNSNFSSVFLDLIPCDGSQCYGKEKLEQRLGELKISIVYSYQEFVENQYNQTPLKINKKNLMKKPNMNQYYKTQLMRNQIFLYDRNIFNFFSGVPKLIPQLSSSATDLDGFDKNLLFRFELQVSISQSVIQRENYTLLQLIGDVGALHSTLFTLIKLFFSSILSIGVLLNNHLLNGVFRTKQNSDSFKTIHFKLSYFEWIKHLPQTVFSKCCSKPTRYQIMHKVGMRRIERELDIVYFLRKQFQMRSIIKALSSKHARSLARRQQSLIINDLKDSWTTETETESDFDASVFIPSSKLEHDLFNSLNKFRDKTKYPKITAQVEEFKAETHSQPSIQMTAVIQTKFENSILELKSMTQIEHQEIQNRIDNISLTFPTKNKKEFKFKITNRNLSTTKLQQ